MRQFGSYEGLNERIDWYLQAANPIELYRKVIERWEQDYGQPDPACENVVRESLVHLWAARRGLSETELLESLGAASSPLPRALWSPLYLASGDALVNRGGLLTFAHDFLREAVRDVYLPTEGRQQSEHRTLAEYFAAQQKSSRQLDELPWQWQEASEWRKLADLLAAPAIFAALWKKDQFEVKAYWTRIEAHSPLRMDQVYAPVIEAPARASDTAHARLIGRLLENTGKPGAALRLFSGLVDYWRVRGDRAQLSFALSDQAHILHDRGDLDGAMTLLKEVERICRELGNRDELQAALCNLSVIFYARGDLDGAMALMKEQERICRELGNKDGLQRSLGHQATILHDRGDLDGAMALHKEEERICRELGDKDGISRSLGNQALTVSARGDLEGAMALEMETERICREQGNKRALALSLFNQAMRLSKSRNNLQQAKTKCAECIRIVKVIDGVNPSIADAEHLLLHLRLGLTTGKYGRTIFRVLRSLSLITLGASGLALCVWKPWLWIIGGPLMISSAIFLVLGTLPSRIRTAGDRRTTQWHADGTLERMIGFVLRVLLSITLGASGLALGLWKPYLWIFGGPLTIFSAIYLVVAISPRRN